MSPSARAEKTWLEGDAFFSIQLPSLYKQGNPIETSASCLFTRPDAVLQPGSL